MGNLLSTKGAWALYKVSIDQLKNIYHLTKKHLSPNYKLDTKYVFKKERYGEKHFYEYSPTGGFSDELKNVLLNQPKAYKIDIALGYPFYDPVNDEECCFYPNIANTVGTRELANGLKYPKSGVKLKATTGFVIRIDYRDHALGDSHGLVPDFIKKNKYIVNFRKPNNKYDANALYLWCLDNEMPCGRFTTIEAYDSIIDDIKNVKICGFLECDMETPEQLKDYFSEMTPIFKNIEIEPTAEVIGQHMFDYNQTRGKNMAKACRMLIRSYFAHSHRTFKSFMEQLSDARREREETRNTMLQSVMTLLIKLKLLANGEDKSIVANMMKRVGNAAFVRSGMDMTKHKEGNFLSDEKQIKQAIEPFTHLLRTEFSNRTVGVVKQNAASSLLILFTYLSPSTSWLSYDMDTDSGYIAFSDENPFPNHFKPELIDHFNGHKYAWFPSDDTKENAAFDPRTPGLFKEEFRCNVMVSLPSKNYTCYLSGQICNETGKEKIKLSAKGVQKSKNANVLYPDNFEAVVKGQQFTFVGKNTGFRIRKETNSIITFSQTKTALSYYYGKRQVLKTKEKDQSIRLKMLRSGTGVPAESAKVGPKKTARILRINIAEFALDTMP
ncbi:hypothetical protein ON010_g9208 [Phytophthora cinnamomi]|nr:hypothetical protein ON010_g9208 [Phytophthora cinnamomi]